MSRTILGTNTAAEREFVQLFFFLGLLATLTVCSLAEAAWSITVDAAPILLAPFFLDEFPGAHHGSNLNRVDEIHMGCGVGLFGVCGTGLLP